MLRRPSRLAAAAASVVLVAPLAVDAADVRVYGAPGYDAATGVGYRDDGWQGENLVGASTLVPRPPGPTPVGRGWQVSETGIAVGWAEYSDGTGGPDWRRGLRWSAAGGEGLSGVYLLEPDSVAYDVNDSGLAVGMGVVGTFGQSVVAWRPESNQHVIMNDLGTVGYGKRRSIAWRVNNAGVAVGEAMYAVYGDDRNYGQQPIVWSTIHAPATLLPTLGTSLGGSRYGVANDINESGLIVGYSAEWPAEGRHLGRHAVAWAADEHGDYAIRKLGGTEAIVETFAFDLSETGTAVGFGYTDLGERAVRWRNVASDNPTVEALGVGTQTTSGLARAYALAVNDAGAAVGWAQSYAGDSTTPRGTEALLWDASSSQAIVLPGVSPAGGGFASSQAIAINNDGLIGGFATLMDGDTTVRSSAVVWKGASGVLDLNSLDLAGDGGTWTLNRVEAISNSGWISGRGTFDPDGDAPAYGRAFLLRLGASDVTVTPGQTYAGTNAVALDGRTTAALRDGTASGERSVTLDFQPGGNFSIGGAAPVGDVLKLVGTQSDLFVLELTYDDAGLTAADEAGLFVQWLDELDGLWKNAVAGNTPAGSTGTPHVGVSYDDYLADALSPVLGAYGNDAETNTVWAVLNHNSLYAIAPNVAAVPEPAAMLGGASLVSLLALRRRGCAGRS